MGPVTGCQSAAAIRTCTSYLVTGDAGGFHSSTTTSKSPGLCVAERPSGAEGTVSVAPSSEKAELELDPHAAIIASAAPVAVDPMVTARIDRLRCCRRTHCSAPAP